MTKKLLLIMVKNPALGKVKTRLAASVGNTKALELYRYLLEYTAEIAQASTADLRVCYSPEILEKDAFEGERVQKIQQVSGDLGLRMQAAFEAAFSDAYEQVLIIGSDCYELNTSLLEAAFTALDKTDVVLGPTYDGGYYLLGMKRLIPELFCHKKWSTATVFEDSLTDIKRLDKSYALLPKLNDIDYIEDVPDLLRAKFDM